MPVNWYAALVLIVLVGIGSVVLARYNYGKASNDQPTIGETWHSALEIDVCGDVQPGLPETNPTASTGLTSAGNGVLVIAPKSSGEAGSGATLAKFASEYTGMKLTNSTLQYPGTGNVLYKNGDKCAKGTPDAGKKGTVRARTFNLSTTSSKGNETKLLGGAYTSAAGRIKFANGQLIVVGFVPTSAKLPKPSSSIELALVQAVQGSGSVVTTTTTTTAPPGATTTTTAPVTTTTVPVTTTTVPVTTTTAKHATSTTQGPALPTTTTSP
jgi:hypothetical protein